MTVLSATLNAMITHMTADLASILPAHDPHSCAVLNTGLVEDQLMLSILL